jgi:hypothetical protein
MKFEITAFLFTFTAVMAANSCTQDVRVPTYP